MFRLFECCALSFFERFVLSFSLKIERFVSDSAEIWICGLYSATQWTSAIDLTNRKVYYKTAYNNNIRCISMKKIDFDKVKYQSYPLDKELKQPVEEIIVK